MNVMTAKDGTLIYSEDTLKDYLSSNGLDYDEIAYSIFPEKEDIDRGFYVYKDDVDDYERWYSELHNQVLNVYEEISEICDEFTVSRKGTKAQFAEKIKKAFFEGIEDLQVKSLLQTYEILYDIIRQSLRNPLPRDYKDETVGHGWPTCAIS